jgi:MSHA biogenesis protein MshM
MYQDYFGLSELPFTLTPNTHFFLKSATHQQALEMLSVALKHREGFLKVTGEVGTGKTLLCRKLLNLLDGDFVTAWVPNPNFAAETLYCVLADELGANLKREKVNPILSQIGGYLNSDVTTEKHVLALRQINDCLLRHAGEGRPVVLIIDEAQSMPRDTLEALRLLTNLETESEKLLQVVLFGQPELDTLLAAQDLRQLRQRITFQHHLQAFGREDIERYISHRMLLAGYQGGRLFEADAIALLTHASSGIPRLINILCHKALMLCFGQGDRMVRAKHMRAAINDTESCRQSDWLGWRRLFA